MSGEQLTPDEIARRNVSAAYAVLALVVLGGLSILMPIIVIAWLLAFEVIP